MTYAQLIQPVLWAIFGGTSIYFATRAFRAHRKGNEYKTSLRVAVVALLMVFIIVPSIAVVPAGFRGVVYRWSGGVDPRERGEGVSFLVPWLQHVTISSVRTQKVLSNKVFSQSADLQEITVVASVNFHIDATKAAELYQKVGPQYRSTVIQPALFQRTKAAVGQIKAEDFALQRDNLAMTIQKQLTSQLSGYGIVIEYVNIEDAIFDPAFVKAVKNKIIAQQKAKEQFNLIAARRAEKTQVIITAQGTARSVLIQAKAQAKANRLIQESTAGVNVQWQWITKWDGTLPTTLVAGGGQANPLILGLPTP